MLMQTCRFTSVSSAELSKTILVEYLEALSVNNKELFPLGMDSRDR